MRNPSSYPRETRIALRLPKVVTIFLLYCLLIATILILAQPAFSDDDLLLYIPSIIAERAGRGIYGKGDLLHMSWMKNIYSHVLVTLR